MTVLGKLGIRTQVVVLAVVPLAFLLLTLVLVLALARISEQSTLLSQRATRIAAVADKLEQAAGQMNRTLAAYLKTRKPKDLADFDAASSLLPGLERTLADLTRGDKSVEPAATRFLKDVNVYAVQVAQLRTAIVQKRQAEILRILASPQTKAVGLDFEQAKVGLSSITANTVVIASLIGRRNIAFAEELLLACVSLGVLSTIVLAVLFGLRLVRRLGALADNARRLRAGEAPPPVRGTDEISQLDAVYRTLLQQVVEANRELDELREAERAAKVRLEHAVRAYGDLAADVARGRLSARVTVDDPNDELGQLGASLNAMAESLERLVDEIRGAAASLASATAEILASTNEQVASATEEAAAVRETAVTVLQVRQTAELAAQKTRLVAELAQRVHDTAEEGRSSVEQSVRGSEESKGRMEVLAERILNFSDQAQAIAEINATVATLAEQSNLLAVNAGIEAAKAGESGRGFAVVAAEVKELGTRSKEATVQVRRIVAEIQRSAQNAVIAAEQGMRVAENSTTVAQRSGAAMDVLAAGIADASDAAQQISASAEQQQAGMDQIALAMQSIEQASVQSVAATQQVERAASDLSRLAEQLTATIGHHVRGVGSEAYEAIS